MSIPEWDELYRKVQTMLTSGQWLSKWNPNASTPEWDELMQELHTMIPPAPDQWPDRWIILQGVKTSDNHTYAWCLSIQDDEFPGSAIIAVRDEKLLAKLRSVKGQFVHQGLPVFYYEYCEIDPRQRIVPDTR